VSDSPSAANSRFRFTAEGIRFTQDVVRKWEWFLRPVRVWARFTAPGVEALPIVGI
jgi:hypothetical protein